MSVLNAERIKLTSTKSPLWCSLIAVVVSVGFAAIMGAAYKSMASSGDNAMGEFTVAYTQAGAAQFGAMLVMIMSALAVTTEYRFGVIRTTFQAIPNRSQVIGGKALLLAVIAAVLGLIIALASFFMAQSISGESLSIGDGSNARELFGIPIYFALLAVLAVGVGTLIRQSAGAISLLLMWPLVIESLATMIPKVGKYIGEFGPFNNATHFLGSGANFDFRWGPWGSLLYFAAFVAIVFGAALVAVNKRDA
ncbi:ABC-2 type transport system permease protein [Rhodococcus sp. LBL1]|uniref:ABC-2 type transport system permease protein n=1 Tax=Prescottella agglutinans TaxID=1644129 RepID=A0ABT6M3E4_9NOCA|nr:ABC transporter permease [Prescottella agglutinans]MDH6278832.1 ABC-2 type transport system permease protein [Prescottella agglutinans]MDH6680508.1 ABC-2 type transport system permease protein [Rhodococcus sp. LBL1]MDH6685937.1 ABC-2 type transport system permease protein [Rhodococcus sp. LBL2]